MDITKTVFRRKFALNMYKNEYIRMAEMSFTKDFVNDGRGSPYPLRRRDPSAVEKVNMGEYHVIGGASERYFCAFFPYATYRLMAEEGGRAGFSFVIGDVEARILMENGNIAFYCNGREEASPIGGTAKELAVTCRPGAFDVYVGVENGLGSVHTFSCAEFADSNVSEIFSGARVYLICADTAVKNVFSCVDCGISQADIRPVRYENGEVMQENGRVFFTLSVRMQAGAYQGIFAWTPSTAKFEMTGALFFDAGDGRWCGDVASSLLYHREKGEWYLWVCSFSHGHGLAHASFKGDVRYGVNVLDVKLMPRSDSGDINDFAAMKGDEDPDFFYDTAIGKWRMAICRVDPATRAYRYVFFESDDPFEGYKYVGKGLDGAETGGSFVKIDGELYFICGNDFKSVSDYRIYGKNGMTKAVFDIPDGGFRGWGTVVPVCMGTRMRYFWLTFDRHNGSDYNWSYGNLYVFEAE